nr:MAG TPA: hypothetical protein [Caudoviricetes sp.]
MAGQGAVYTASLPTPFRSSHVDGRLTESSARNTANSLISETSAKTLPLA